MITSEYYKFADVFSKSKTKVIAFHCSYNLKINLEEGTWSLVGTIYSLLAFKWETLKKIIKENLSMEFI